jgi:hypothetical protein
VIRTTYKSNDSLTKSTNPIDKLDDDMAKLEQTTTHMAKLKDEREDGDNGIWMNEKN